MSLDCDSITFGKYKDKRLSDVLKDRGYCHWLIEQEWFQKNYEYLYNQVVSYDPLSFFVSFQASSENSNLPKTFLESFPYFNLLPLEKINLLPHLSKTEEVCYSFYLQVIESLKKKIRLNLEKSVENIYNISAPKSWLKVFEKETGLDREVFKSFLASYGLPNIPSLVEAIKKEAGVDYKGAKSFVIAKKNSLVQEAYWYEILKKCFGDDVGAQFKYEAKYEAKSENKGSKSCFFDFLHIKRKVIYECKIALKEFNERQYRKYRLALKEYEIIYLIDTDCILDIKKGVLYTTDPPKYEEYIEVVKKKKDEGKDLNNFDNLVVKFIVEEIEENEI
jgi:hypothetical protein